MPLWKHTNVLLDNQTIPQFQSVRRRMFSSSLPGEILSPAEQKRREAYRELYDDYFGFVENVREERIEETRERLKAMGLLAFIGARGFVGNQGVEMPGIYTVLARAY